MNYKKPILYKVNFEDIINCACVSGDAATFGISCKAGPEAGGSGCEAGAAAGRSCQEGAAAGSKCDNGVCFD